MLRVIDFTSIDLGYQRKII